MQTPTTWQEVDDLVQKSRKETRERYNRHLMYHGATQAHRTLGVVEKPYGTSETRR